MNNRKSVVATALVGALCFAGAAFADADVKKGEKVFKKCKACHFADVEKNKAGPTLLGVFGRVSGTLEDFKFSAPMVDAAITWDEETMDEFLTKPKDMIKGTKMTFAGLKKEKDRVNVIAYLKEVTATGDEMEATEAAETETSSD